MNRLAYSIFLQKVVLTSHALCGSIGVTIRLDHKLHLFKDVRWSGRRWLFLFPLARLFTSLLSIRGSGVWIKVEMWGKHNYSEVKRVWPRITIVEWAIGELHLKWIKILLTLGNTIWKSHYKKRKSHEARKCLQGDKEADHESNTKWNSWTCWWMIWAWQSI